MNLRGVIAEALETMRQLLGCLVAFQDLPRWFDLVAVGKASASIVDGVLAAWGPELASGIVVLPDDAPAPSEHPRLRVLRASHPLPDARSVAAGEASLQLAREGKGTELLVFVSGGASSLVAVPIEGVTLETFQAVTRALLLSGADVRAVNVVRRHLSQVHGGGLARAAKERRVQTWIVSDVVDGAPHDVGSGPASTDPTTIAGARDVLARYAAAYRDLPLVETLKEGDEQAAGLSSDISIQPRELAEAVATNLQRRGFSARVLEPSTADVLALAEEYANLARALAPREAVVRSAEPSVRVTALHPGCGGRSTHLAALVASSLPAGVEFMAAASDGIDGSSGTSGAIVDARSFRRRQADLSAAIAAFDTGALHRAVGTALPEGPTGLNFADVHVLVRHEESGA